jgi:hypothetical protein
LWTAAARSATAGYDGNAMTRRFTLAYIATLIVFLALDAVWLTTMAQRLYRPGSGT